MKNIVPTRMTMMIAIMAIPIMKPMDETIGDSAVVPAQCKKFKMST